MFFIPVGIVAALVGVVTFFWTGANGGTAAVANVGGQALTGTMLYGISALLVISGAFFVISGVLRAIRKFAVTIAALALVGGGGIATIVPQSVSNYVADHCPERVQTLTDCQQLRGQ